MRTALIIIGLFLAAAGWSTDRAADNIRNALTSIEDLNNSEREELSGSIREALPAYILQAPAKDDYEKVVSSSVFTGLFEESDMQSIAAAATLSIRAVYNGADAESVSEIAQIAFSSGARLEDLVSAAKAYAVLQREDIDEEISRQFISYGIYNDWAELLIPFAEGLVRGKSAGVPLDKLALAFIIRIDQELVRIDRANPGFTAMVNRVIEEEIEYLRSNFGTNSERSRRDAIYRAMVEAKENGLPDFTATDFYYNAVEEKWEAGEAEKLFKALAKGYREGLPSDKLALAFIIRMETRETSESIDQIIREESDYVRSLYQQTAKIPLEKRSIPKPAQEVRLQRMNIPSLQASIASFLGVPYVWGGESRRGTDCSGFTQTVYNEQGIIIPRVSYQQYEVGTFINRDELHYGDLVFFNKFGWGRVSHVGIYVGNGKFTHASCSKGVTTSALTKKYYRTRYVGAKRIVT